MPWTSWPVAQLRDRFGEWLAHVADRAERSVRSNRSSPSRRRLALEQFEARDLPNGLHSLLPAAFPELASTADAVASGYDNAGTASADRYVERTVVASDDAGELVEAAVAIDTTTDDSTAEGQQRANAGSRAVQQPANSEDPSFESSAIEDLFGTADAATNSSPHDLGLAPPSTPQGNSLAAGLSLATLHSNGPGIEVARSGNPPSTGAPSANGTATNLALLVGMTPAAQAAAASAPPRPVPAATAAATPAVAPNAQTTAAPDPKLFIPQNLAANLGATVTVPVQMLVTEQSGILVSEVDVAIAYDSTKFTVSNAQMGSLLSPRTFDVTYFDTTSFPGEILMSAASSISQQSFAFNQQGPVFTVDFTVKAGATAGASRINLQQQFDMGGGFTQPTDVLDNQLNPLTLTPAPTNASNDPVDGIFNILGATKTATATALTASPNPSVYGQSVTFTAVVTGSGGTPTGSVTFMDGTTTLGTGTLSNGTATFASGKLKAGAHSITAVYGGDTNFAGSTSSVSIQTVNKASTTNKLTVSPTTSVYGQSVTLTAAVSVVGPGGGTPGGTVIFKNGNTVVGTARLNASGVATLQTTSLPVGSDSLTAVWFGDSNYVGSTAATVSEVVSKDASTVALSSSLNPSRAGQSVTFTAAVAAALPGSGTPMGTVTFMNGSAVLGTGTLSAGRAIFTTTTLPVGTDSITAVYGGNGNFNGRTSTALNQVVNA